MERRVLGSPFLFWSLTRKNGELNFHRRVAAGRVSQMVTQLSLDDIAQPALKTHLGRARQAAASQRSK